MMGGLQFQQPLALILALTALTGVYILWKALDTEGKVVGVTRVLFFVLLAVAISGPFIQDVKTVPAQKDIVVLEDSSRSTGPMQNFSLSPEGASIERKTILSGNNSDLGSALKQALQPNQSYVLLTDGRTSEDLTDILNRYRAVNSNISVVKPDMSSEKSVYISGPSTTVPGAKTQYKIIIGSSTVDKTAELKVTLDNETVLNKKVTGSWSFNRTFEQKGTHRIKAEIKNYDRYQNNNLYYKTVEVREKPEILFIGQSSGLTEKLSKFYDIEIRKDLPEDLSKYYAVISQKALNSPELSTFISRGNGYLYIGDYKDPADYLPVKASNEDYDTESTRVVIGIETSSQEGSSIRNSKDLAYALVKELPLNTKVAAYYYSQDAHILSDLTTLAYNRDSLLRKISSVESIAETRHGVGLKAGKQLADGEGNVVIFTDGNFFEEQKITKQEIKQNAFEAAESIDVNLHIVGVGENPNRDFLRELAQRGGGKYFSAENLWRLGFRFGAGGGTSAYKPLAVIETDHFITENLGLDTSVSLFDEVKPKETANILVSGPGKREYLTSWRYGLGRVAAVSGGQPTLSRVLSNDPALVSRTVSWTVGKPVRKQDRWVEVSETEAPGKVEVTASFPVKGLSYSSEKRYTGTATPGTLGFHSYAGEKYSYNYNSEIRKIGYNEDKLEKITSTTVGEIYTPSEFNSQKYTGTGREKVSYTRPLTEYFLVAALIFFLGEVGYRKLNGKK